MLLKVIDVDTEGFNGRDYFPAKSDIGQIVSVLAMAAWVVNAECDYSKAIADDDDRVLADAIECARYEIIEREDAGTVMVRVWDCLTKDGRRLQLMDHEVEMFRS
jgi:hypothetical protein